MLKIRFRRLIDEAIKFLYEALTGLKADDRHYAVKEWWYTTFDSCGQGKNLNEAAINDLRHKECLKLLRSKGFSKLPIYQNLIRTGTLKYLTQTSIELRRKANWHAHELVDMSEFRESIKKAKDDMVIDDICSPDDLPSIMGMIDFVESLQTTSSA